MRIEILALIFGVGVAGAAEPDWKGMLNREDWFGLRDAAEAQAAPSLYAGVVAAAFHREADAIRILRAVEEERPWSKDADTAGEMLVNLYFRSGRYRSALGELKPLLERHRKRRDLVEAETLFRGLAQQGDMEVVKRAPSRVEYHILDGNLFLPVVVNGMAGEYLLDTGANISVLGASEAERLGLKVLGGGGSGKDYAGNDLQFQTAVAAELRIGEIVLKNVSFGVLPDDQQPFAEFPKGKRGVLGIPILLAAQTWRWGKDGMLEAGFRSNGCGGGRGNLAFSGANPLLQAEFEKTPLTFQLDTGATSTDLWPPFARRYGSRLGGREKSKITGVGGSKELPAARLRTFEISIAGRAVRLPDTRVLLKAAGASKRRYYGNLGLDLLQQTMGVTLDFGAMCMAVE